MESIAQIQRKLNANAKVLTTTANMAQLNLWVSNHHYCSRHARYSV